MERELFATPGRLAQSVTLAIEQGGAGDYHGVKAQCADRQLHLALDAVVKNLGLGISPHGTDHAQPAHTGSARGACQGQHGVQINCTKSGLTAGHRNGGAQRNEHVIGRRHLRFKQGFAHMRHQPCVGGAGWKFRCPAAQGVDRCIGAGFIGR